MVSKLSPILVVVIITAMGTIVISMGILTNINFAFILEYKDIHKASAASLPLSEVEHFKSKERAGDARMGDAHLKITSEFVDPSNHCEFCSRIEYSTGPVGEAGIAYKSDDVLDLTGAKSVVFFARGEKSGEKVKFLVAGKNTTTSSDMQSLSGIFKNKKFEAITQDISLTSDWKKYRIDLTGTNLKDITYPFGFITKGKDAEEKTVFYLKGVTYDSQ